MSTLPINQIITKTITFSGSPSPFKVRLLPAFSFPPSGTLYNTELYVHHRKKEKLRFLNIFAKPMSPSGEINIDIKLGKSGVGEYDLIRRRDTNYFELTGSFIVRDGLFIIESGGEYIYLKIYYAGASYITGECNIGVEMLFERLE